ncbi:MAG: class I SAM-dependent methyltransferase [Bacteroidia bacterium]|nr:class I SAM-dependent methyltransferase [Bacteroidia bacterium]
MRRPLKYLVRSFGYDIIKKGVHPEEGEIPADLHGTGFGDLFMRVKNASVTSVEPLYHLYEAVQHTTRAALPGVFVECGVWKGGSAMMMALSLLKNNKTDREIWMYDTFEGMSAPGEMDVDFRGDSASDLLSTQPKGMEYKNVWCVSPLEEVQANMNETGYPKDKMKFIRGKVEDTIPGTLPGQIALLRLDTDWYSSTLHELIHLYPLLVSGGILIIDDYGHWKGARKAVDEYFATLEHPPMLHRIDYSVRAAVKP